MAQPTLTWSSERVRIPELPPTPKGSHVHHCACGRYAFCHLPVEECDAPTPDRCFRCEGDYVALMQKNAAAASVEFTVESAYGVLTHQGLVQITMGKQVLRMDVRKAREIYAMLGECIEAAISDEVFVKFMTQRAGLTEHAAVLALRDLRLLRQGSDDVVNPS